MEKVIQVITDPSAIEAILVAVTLVLVAAGVAVKMFKVHAASTPDKTDDQVAEVAEQVVDVAKKVVAAKRGK